MLVAGCQEQAASSTRRVVAHRLPACDVEGSKMLLTPLGDFESPGTVSVDLKGSREVDLPPEMRGVEASTSPAGARGVGYAEPPDDVHLTMWSAASSCDAADDFPVPESLGGQAMTAFDDGGAVIIAGLDPINVANVSKSAFAWAWDARTGQQLPLANRAHRVTFASATPFGKGALIAGGFDRKFFPPRYLDTALVYRDGDIQEPPIAIGDARAEHGAVVLASGATLLVGGEDERGVVDTLVSITPTETPPYGVADLFMLGSLARARKLPAVLRLATDEILVAGGVDGSGDYVSTLEWFSKDGRPCAGQVCTIDPPELAAVTDLSFIALTGGGALGVGGLARDTATPNLDVFWISISNEGAVVEKLPPLTSQQRGTKKVRLVAAGDGAPWLWNGTAWLRFDPWFNTFSTPDAAPEDGPDDDIPAPVAVDPGLFVWLARQTSGDSSKPATLRGFRYGVRGPYTIDPDFVLADPRHLAPSRPPVDGELWTGTGGLHLAASAGAVIADATYADVVVSGETPDSSLPALTFGSWAIGIDCAWPGAGTKFTVTRTGRMLATSVDGGGGTASGSCMGPEGRIAIGLRGSGPDAVTVRTLVVRRR
jgi:hypothetical protein